MDIELSTEDLAFREDVRQFFGENEIKPGEDYMTWRINWFEKAREKGGWDVPKWPVEFGGPGWTPTQHYIWEQETARIDLPFDLPFGLGMLAPVLIAYGSKEQQERFLPDIRARKVNWCQGYSEPGAGSDLANLKTKAELSEDGTFYTVNGSKIWTSLAHIADWIFCLTRTDDSGIKQQGVTFLLFPMKQEGIEVRPIITLGGTHTVNTVHFTDVKVPVENRVGEEGQGWTYAKGLLQHERTGLAGLSKSLVALEALKEQAQTVPRGNGTLMDDPGFKAKVAELEIDLMASEYTELRSLASAAAGAAPGPESSILKLKGTEIQQRIQKLTVEASGIYAAAWGDQQVGFPFAKGGMGGYLSSRAYTIYGGASEVQRDVIAKNVLGLKRSGK
ncbi:MAG: pimeloyl-CoA dehydrogenase large subunit [Gammaproteobacteria bacterium]|jgi:alkylation response protein AidB-like acyl-CoA dehydrogenase|nr:pimeloyl-CoA dehydrogenase large subunit [Gammaproteobacteria bacterium]MBT4491669.1 pimeloyl-CoA dehydrogenase large subunit [Gammaproteobacteria bacterium]MBT7370774.1 pimeloyl-CoA dehydrogenase large subunit [Gammaproteobacteria bacterium]